MPGRWRRRSARSCRRRRRSRRPATARARCCSIAYWIVAHGLTVQSPVSVPLASTGRSWPPARAPHTPDSREPVRHAPGIQRDILSCLPFSESIGLWPQDLRDFLKSREVRLELVARQVRRRGAPRRRPPARARPRRPPPRRARRAASGAGRRRSPPRRSGSPMPGTSQAARSKPLSEGVASTSGPNWATRRSLISSLVRPCGDQLADEVALLVCLRRLGRELERSRRRRGTSPRPRCRGGRSGAPGLLRGRRRPARPAPRPAPGARRAAAPPQLPSIIGATCSRRNSASTGPRWATASVPSGATRKFSGTPVVLRSSA